MKYFSVLAAVGLSLSSVPAHPADSRLAGQSGLIELTTSDFTKLEKIRSTDLRLFGIALGEKVEMAEFKAQRAGFRTLTFLESSMAMRELLIKKNPSTTILPPFPTEHLDSVEVFDAASPSWEFPQNQMFDLLVDDRVVTEIRLWPGVAPRLSGEAQKLFQPAVMEVESSLRLRLLGREDNRSSERGFVGQLVEISYDQEGIRLSQVGDGSVSFRLVMPVKRR